MEKLHVVTIIITDIGNGFGGFLELAHLERGLYFVFGLSIIIEGWV
jgi:hypothetical protein